MPTVKPGQFTDVEVKRTTTLTGGLLKKPLPILTQSFQVAGGEAEFIQLVKGADWLTQSACGPTNRQQGLKRTQVAVELMAAATAACGAVAEAPAPGDSPAPSDPMAASLGYDDSPPAFAGRDSSDNTPPKKARVRKGPVTVTMPAKCKEKYPSCHDTRQVTCFVNHKRQVWVAVADVPWLVRYTHEEFCLGGVPLVEDEEEEGSAPAPAFAGPGGADHISWDFAASAWVAKGRQLKPDNLSAEEAERLGVGAAAWRASTYPEKKELAYACMQHWLGQCAG